MTLSCQRCGACCRWPGQVKVSASDITAMAAYLGMSEDAFVQQYTALRPDRQGLMLAEKDNGECVLLDGVDCRVHPVKPMQCRTFPSQWTLPDYKDKCPAQANRVARKEIGP